MDKIRISNIKFLNTLPFRYGLAKYSFPDDYKVEITEDYPSECARKLQRNECEIGIVPVAATHDNKDLKIISDYCIASQHEVKSVMLFSDCSLNEITGILLDYQSMTSVRLVRYLAEKKWNLKVDWIKAKPGYEKNISGKTAGLIIGDRALDMYDGFKYKVDLSKEWNELTGLPFVFAVWVVQGTVPADFIDHFNKALSLGVSNIKTAAESVRKNYSYEILPYLTDNIYYQFDDRCKQAKDLFLSTAF